MNRAVFLDRDGVLNVDRGYVHRKEEWEWNLQAREAVRYLNDRGYCVIVVTNQSGIARGYYGEADLVRLNEWIQHDLKALGAHVDGFYHCPHGPDDGCVCRKPRPGMLNQAMQDFDIDPGESLMVGDRDSDMQAAAAAGVKGCLYQGGDLCAFVARALSEVC